MRAKAGKIDLRKEMKESEKKEKFYNACKRKKSVLNLNILNCVLKKIKVF